MGSDQLHREVGALRERLSRPSEAVLRISESLDFDTALQGALDSARSLTSVRCGVTTLLDDGARLAFTPLMAEEMTAAPPDSPSTGRSGLATRERVLESIFSERHFV